MNTDLTNNIYKDLKKYLTGSSVFSPKVLRDVQINQFPLVVLSEENNFTAGGTTKYKQREIIDTIYWEVNIYSTDQTLGNSKISKVEVCDELKVLVDDIMSKKYRLERISCKPTPNIDQTIRRITMRYTCNLLTNKKMII